MNKSELSIYGLSSVGYFVSPEDDRKLESLKFKVFIIDGNRNEPHIHIWDDNTNGQEFHTCVCLTKIEYFHHDGSENVLTPKQKESLVKFLKSECVKNRRYKTNWEYALSMWNDNNQDKILVDEDSEVLDYTLLK